MRIEDILKKLPKSFKDITVKQYQDIHPFIGEDSIDGNTKIVEYFSGCSFDFLQTQTETGDLKKAFKKVSFLFSEKQFRGKRYLRINGCWYKLESNPDKLNGGQYTSIKTYCQIDPIKHLHDIAAVAYKSFKLKHQYKDGNQIYTKYFTWVYDSTNHEEISKAILERTAKDIVPALFFCSRALKRSIATSKDYLKAQKIINNRIKEILSDESFMQSGDFTQLLTKS